jgi:hypothetical protein
VETSRSAPSSTETVDEDKRSDTAAPPGYSS